MNRIIKLYICVLLGVSFISCDSFLDVNPKAEVVNDDMFNTAEGCEDALTGIYAKMKDKALYGKDLTWHVTDALAQDLNVSSITATDEYQYIGTYQYGKASNTIYAMWKSAYQVIGYANNAIRNIEAKDPNTFIYQDMYLGECYAIRAMMHFEMLRLFAPHVASSGGEQGIPYVTKYTFQHTPFSSVSKCYEYIISDLKKAQELLKEDVNLMKYPRNDDPWINTFLKGRELHFNYYATTAILARVYWTSHDLVNAKKEALKVIDSEKFPLANKDEITNLVGGIVSPKESLFGIYSTGVYDQNVKMLHNKASGSASLFIQGYTFPYTNIYKKDLGNNSGVDSRLNWFASPTNGGPNTYTCHKLVDKIRLASPEGANTPLTRKLTEGVSVIRIPEMYYIVAEAMLAEGDARAVDYINKVLDSRGLNSLENRAPAIPLTIDVIFNERHKEFFCEGQRWFDMKRGNNDIVSNAQGRTIPASNEYYVLPIPMEEFDARDASK